MSLTVAAGSEFLGGSDFISAGDVVVDVAALCGAFAVTELCGSSFAGGLLGGLLPEERLERGTYG